MPMYEYLCPECGVKFEKRGRYSDESYEACPVCKSIAGKVMSVVNHTFGWTLSERSHERFGPRDEIVKDV